MLASLPKWCEHFFRDRKEFQGDNRIMKTILLKNASVVLPSHHAGDLSVLIENGKIIEVSSKDKKLKADEEIDISNTTLFAGFIDIHIHGAVGVDTNEADAD